jgi:hypothetical protein
VFGDKRSSRGLRCTGLARWNEWLDVGAMEDIQSGLRLPADSFRAGTRDPVLPATTTTTVRQPLFFFCLLPAVFLPACPALGEEIERGRPFRGADGRLRARRCSAPRPPAVLVKVRAQRPHASSCAVLCSLRIQWNRLAASEASAAHVLKRNRAKRSFE